MKKISSFLFLVNIILAVVAGLISCGNLPGDEKLEDSLTPITEFSIEPDNAAAVVTFTVPEGAESVTIYVGTSINLTKEEYGQKIKDVESPYKLENLQNGEVYYFSLIAHYPEGESELSTVKSCRPSLTAARIPAPENINASVESGELHLGFDAVTGATSYDIFLHTETAVSASVFTEAKNTTSTTVTWTGLDTGVTYYCVIRAKNETENGTLSDVIQIQIPTSFSVSETLRPTIVTSSQNHFATALGLGDGVLLSSASRMGDGQAYIWTRGTTDAWELVQTLNPSSDVEYYGNCIDVDGTNLVLGSRLKNNIELNGKIFLYTQLGDTEWSGPEIVTCPGTERKLFWVRSVDLNGNRIAAGGFNATGLFDYEYDYQGVVYIFEKNTTGAWELSSTITPEDPDSNLHFGSSVLITEDALFVTSWDPGSGDYAVLIFKEISDGVWNFNQRISEPGFGSMINLSFSQGDLIVSAIAAEVNANPNVGAVYVYREIDTNVWSKVQKISEIGDYRKYNGFGYGMAAHDNYMVVTPWYAKDDTVPLYAHIFFRQPIGTWEFQQSLQVDITRFNYLYSDAGITDKAVAIGGNNPSLPKVITFKSE